MPPLPGRRRRNKGPYNTSVQLVPQPGDRLVSQTNYGASRPQTNLGGGRTLGPLAAALVGPRRGRGVRGRSGPGNATYMAGHQAYAPTIGPQTAEPDYAPEVTVDDVTYNAGNPAPGSTAANYDGGMGIRANGQVPIVPTQYDVWLKQDPIYNAAIGRIDTDRNTQLSRIAAAIANAVGLFGGAPTQTQAGLGPNAATMTTADISALRDSVTAELMKTDAGKAILNSLDWSQIQNMANNATQGEVSTYMRMLNQNKQANEDIANSALARGVFGSGLMGYDRIQENERYAQAQYDASQELLNAITGYGDDFATGEADRGRQRDAAGEEARGRAPEFGSQSGPVGEGEATAPPPSGGGGGGGGGGAAKSPAQRAKEEQDAANRARARAARRRARQRARRAK